MTSQAVPVNTATIIQVYGFLLVGVIVLIVVVPALNWIGE